MGENSNFAFKVNHYADENTLNQIFTHVKYKQFPVVTQGQEEPGPLKQKCKKKKKKTYPRLIQIQCSEENGLSSGTIIHQPKVAKAKDSFKASL